MWEPIRPSLLMPERRARASLSAGSNTPSPTSSRNRRSGIDVVNDGEFGNRLGQLHPRSSDRVRSPDKLYPRCGRDRSSLQTSWRRVSRGTIGTPGTPAWTDQIQHMMRRDLDNHRLPPRGRRLFTAVAPASVATMPPTSTTRERRLRLRHRECAARSISKFTRRVSYYRRRAVLANMYDHHAGGPKRYRDGPNSRRSINRALHGIPEDHPRYICWSWHVPRRRAARTSSSDEGARRRLFDRAANVRHSTMVYLAEDQAAGRQILIPGIIAPYDGRASAACRQSHHQFRQAGGRA